METEELTKQYVEAMRYHRMHGRPEIAQRIQGFYLNDEELPADMRPYLEGDKRGSLYEPSDAAPPPPRGGQGATKKSWRAWLIEVSDIDPDLINRTGMGDVIKIAEANGFLPKE